MPKLSDQLHRNISFWGMAMIVMGLPLSVFLVSVGTFVLAGNWLLEGQYRKRTVQFIKDPLSLILVSIFLIHCIGMAWTGNLAHGMAELRIKLPLLLMPLFLFTSKLPDKKRQQHILLLFVVACMLGSLFGMARYFELTGEELIDNREVSVFISHIRFGLMLTLAFYILAYLLYANWRSWSVAEKVICLGAMLWIAVFLLILGAFTAYVAFASMLVFTLIWSLKKQQNRPLKLAFGSLTLILMAGGFLYVKSISDRHFHEVPFDYRTLAVKTANGRYYTHQKDVLYRENGHRVWNFICWDELKNEWPTRSSVDFGSNDKKGQAIKFTAIRYMTSKGLTKDSVGVHQLTDKDISYIEQGYTNHLYTDKLGISMRVDQFLWALEEYAWQKNANNSSTLQRWVYMEVGWSILKENPLLGVGTGDVFDAYRSAYTQNDRGLEKKFQGISHNQFLTIAIALGFVGFAWFLFTLVYPLAVYRYDYLYVAFVVLMLVSFLSDNTFDRQSGVTLFAFFNAFLIVRREFVETHNT